MEKKINSPITEKFDPNKYYRIRQFKGEKYMGIEDNSSNEIPYEKHNAFGQTYIAYRGQKALLQVKNTKGIKKRNRNIWSFEINEDGTYKIRTKHGGYSLKIQDDSDKNKQEVRLRANRKSTSYKSFDWDFDLINEMNGVPSFTIMNKHTNKYMMHNSNGEVLQHEMVTSNYYDYLWSIEEVWEKDQSTISFEAPKGESDMLNYVSTMAGYAVDLSLTLEKFPGASVAGSMVTATLNFFLESGKDTNEAMYKAIEEIVRIQSDNDKINHAIGQLNTANVNYIEWYNTFKGGEDAYSKLYEDVHSAYKNALENFFGTESLSLELIKNYGMMTFQAAVTHHISILYQLAEIGYNKPGKKSEFEGWDKNAIVEIQMYVDKLQAAWDYIVGDRNKKIKISNDYLTDSFCSSNKTRFRGEDLEDYKKFVTSMTNIDYGYPLELLNVWNSIIDKINDKSWYADFLKVDDK